LEAEGKIFRRFPGGQHKQHWVKLSVSVGEAEHEKGKTLPGKAIRVVRVDLKKINKRHEKKLR
jgi:hypothetical protein